MKLQDTFDESSATILTHGGGHYFPATTNEKQAYIDFYKNQLICHLEEKELQKGVAIEEEEEN
jgi:hypothetical protein